MKTHLFVYAIKPVCLCVQVYLCLQASCIWVVLYVHVVRQTNLTAF